MKGILITGYDDTVSFILPPPCSPRERWYDPVTKRSGKCARFCPVRYFCNVGGREMALSDFGKKVEL